MGEVAEYGYEWVLIFSSTVAEEQVKTRINSIRLLKAAGLVPLTCKSKEEIHVYGEFFVILM
jgi:hypothetical protein